MLGTTPTRRLLVLLVSIVVLAFGGALPAIARPVIQNFLRANVTTDGDFKLYDYSTGTAVTSTSQADFTAGTLTNTTAAATPGSVALNGTLLSGWWNASWGYRKCFTVDHTAAAASTVTEYPVSITVDTAALIAAGKLQPTGADFRAISSTGVAVPLWLEGTINTTTTVLWVQVPTITAGSSVQFCLYYGNATAATVSDTLAPFTYTSLKSIYYPVSQRYATNPTTVKIASFGAGNQAKTGATTISLATAGATGTFGSGIAQPSQPIQVLGPINGRGTGTPFDAIVPISFAGTSFVVPLVYLSTTNLSIFSPFGAATVTITHSGGTALTGSPYSVAAGTSIATSNFPVSNTSAVITSTLPILVSQVTTDNALAAIPMAPSTSTWYGVLNNWADFGFAAAGTATIVRSDGSSSTLTGTAGADLFITGSGTAGGNAAEALAATGTVPITVYADSGDAATFLPAGELSSTYVLPSAATYLSFSCPTIGTVITIGLSPTPATVTCATTGAGPFPTGTPGKALYTGAVPAGTIVKSSSPTTALFYMYYADTGRETNVWGPKQGRQITYPAPTLAAGPEQVAYSGTWESATINSGVTGVFGTLSWNAIRPASTTLTFQVAAAATTAGPWSYVGPDGTAATTYTSSPGALPLSFDGLCCIRLKATLTSTSSTVTPLLNDVTATYDLARLAHTAGTASVVSMAGSPGVSSTAYLVRIKTATAALAGSTATLRELGTSTNLSNLTTATASFMAGPTTQIVVTSGSVTTSVGAATTLDAVTGRSIVLVATPVAAGVTSILRTTLTLDVGIAGGSPLIENDLDVQIVT
jgi:Domain of unknown function (DUF2341)